MLSPGTNPPYHILYPMIALKVHGKLKGIAIFSEQWWGRQVSKLYYPTQARTLAQQMGRWTFYNASYNWKHFDQPTKNYYNALVKGKPTYGYGRFVQLFFKANYPMIIYWNTLEKSASDPALIQEYIASGYMGSVKFARGAYWGAQARASGVPALIPDYIAGTDFTRGLYPAAANKLISVGPSGDVSFPRNFEAGFTGASRWIRVVGGTAGGAPVGYKFKTYYRDWSIELDDHAALPEGFHFKDNGTDRMYLDKNGNLWILANCSALSFTDRTPFFKGDALKELKGIKDDGKGGIDHKTLPKFVQKSILLPGKRRRGKIIKEAVEVEGRDLSGMVSMLTSAVQQLLNRVESLESKK